MKPALKKSLFLHIYIYIAGLLILSLFQMHEWDGPRLKGGVFLILLYIMWILVESKIITSRDFKKEKSSADKGTFSLYAICRGLTLISALTIPGAGKTSGILIFEGLFLFILGAVLRTWAILVLGEYYSHVVRINKNHRVVDKFPYNIIRHPSYTGMFIAHLGFVIFFFNWISFLVLWALFLPAIIIRIVVEEQELTDNLKEYAAYKKNKKRLFPYIW